eukprot:jgi/Tetstr1/460246/TSEL_000481.t1
MCRSEATATGSAPLGEDKGSPPSGTASSPTPSDNLHSGVDGRGREAGPTETHSQRLERYISSRSIFEKYDIGPVLGVGVQGVVRMLTDKTTGATFACKQIGLSRADSLKPDEQARACGLREVLSMCDIRHPGIPELREYYEDSHTLYIVMELVHGTDLLTLLSSSGGPLSEDDARCVLRPLLEAVACLHSHGVVHRDIKLENILITDRADAATPRLVKLVDFGLAFRAQAGCANPRLVQPCGTPAYVAPEMLRAGRRNSAVKEYGKECDLWSIGVLMFGVLSGYLPELIRGLLMLDPTTRLTVDEALQSPWFHDK